MAVSDEFMMLVLAFALNHILVMNYGRNISNVRRFVGAVLTMVIGASSLLTVSSLESAINAPAFILTVVTVIYFIFQLTVILTKETKDVDDRNMAID